MMWPRDDIRSNVYDPPFDGCAFHKRRERWWKGHSWWCMECGHHYFFGRFSCWLRALRIVSKTPKYIRKAWDMEYCPLCLHDW